MISNAKRNLLGINHQIKDDYLQNYLNEFCYKTNRRYCVVNLFDRLMVAAVQSYLCINSFCFSVHSLDLISTT